MRYKIVSEKELIYGKDSIWLVLVRVDDDYVAEAHTLFYKLGSVSVWNETQGELVIEVLEKKLNTLHDFYSASDLLCQGYNLLTMQAMMLYIYTRFAEYEFYGLFWLREEFGFFTQPVLEDLICLKYREDRDIHVYLLKDIKPVGRFIEIKKENDTYFVFKLNPGYP